MVMFQVSNAIIPGYVITDKRSAIADKTRDAVRQFSLLFSTD